jgi:hypothetical protein
MPRLWKEARDYFRASNDWEGVYFPASKDLDLLLFWFREVKKSGELGNPCDEEEFRKQLWKSVYPAVWGYRTVGQIQIDDGEANGLVSCKKLSEISDFVDNYYDLAYTMDHSQLALDRCMKYAIKKAACIDNKLPRFREKAYLKILRDYEEKHGDDKCEIPELTEIIYVNKLVTHVKNLLNEPALLTKRNGPIDNALSYHLVRTLIVRPRGGDLPPFHMWNEIVQLYKTHYKKSLASYQESPS